MFPLSQLSNASSVAFPQSKFSCSLGSSGPSTNIIRCSCWDLMKPAFMLPFTSARSGSQKERTLTRTTAADEKTGLSAGWNMGMQKGEQGTDVCRVFRAGSRWLLPEPLIQRVKCQISYGRWWISITSSNVPNPPGKPMNPSTRVAISILRSCIEFTRIWKGATYQSSVNIIKSFSSTQKSTYIFYLWTVTISVIMIIIDWARKTKRLTTPFLCQLHSRKQVWNCRLPCLHHHPPPYHGVRRQWLSPRWVTLRRKLPPWSRLTHHHTLTSEQHMPGRVQELEWVIRWNDKKKCVSVAV